MQISRILLIISLVVFIISISFLTLKEKKESYAQSILYYRVNDNLNTSKPSLNGLQPLSDFSQLVKTDTYNDAEILMFESLNRIDTIMQKVVYPKNVQFVFGIAGSDNIASKSMLAISLRTCYDDTILNTLIPKTYIMEKGIDQDRWLRDTRDGLGGIYIMKKNIQRQEGFVITNDKEIIIKGFSPLEDYVVCQELLQNPLLISERKINIRIYLLVVVWVNGKGCNMYIYNDGFMYYTPAPFKKGSLNPDENITTGYIDREVYVNNPLTLQDLLGMITPVASNILWNNIINLMTTVARCYIPTFLDANKKIPGTKFTIYGCDIAPADDYTVKLMEVNKGPDLSYKDERDGKLKKHIVEEMLSLVNIIESRTQNFIKIV